MRHIMIRLDSVKVILAAQSTPIVIKQILERGSYLQWHYYEKKFAPSKETLLSVEQALNYIMANRDLNEKKYQKSFGRLYCNILNTENSLVFSNKYGFLEVAISPTGVQVFFKDKEQEKLDYDKYVRMLFDLCSNFPILVVEVTDELYADLIYEETNGQGTDKAFDHQRLSLTSKPMSTIEAETFVKNYSLIRLALYESPDVDIFKIILDRMISIGFFDIVHIASGLQLTRENIDLFAAQIVQDLGDLKQYPRDPSIGSRIHCHRANASYYLTFSTDITYYTRVMLQPDANAQFQDTNGYHILDLRIYSQLLLDVCCDFILVDMKVQDAYFPQYFHSNFSQNTKEQLL